ncbi:MAG: LamG domain-containing protein, partial [Planctomycetota bacterium]
MRPTDHIAKHIKNVNVAINAEVNRKVFDSTLQAFNESKARQSAAPQPNKWRMITRSRITKLAAAAVIIIAVLVGLKRFSSSDEQPQRGPTEMVTVEDAGQEEPALVFDEASQELARELEHTDQMFAAADVGGLLTMLSTGQLESKVAAANYLIKMGEGPKALAVLEKLQAEQGVLNPNNTFTPAVVEIRNQMNAAKGESTPESVVPKTDDLAQSERVRSFKRTGVSSEAEDNTISIISSLLSSGESGPEEIVAGYPVRGGWNSVSQVVPPALYRNLVLYSGRGYNGQINGAQRVNDEVLGGAMAFDGKDDQIDTANVHLEQFTFSVWVAPAGGDLNNRQIFFLTDGKYSYALQGNGSENVGVYVADGNKTNEINEYNWRFDIDRWAHLTVAGDGRTFNIYKNGRLTQTGDIEIEMPAVTGTLSIGGAERHGGKYWDGFIDEVALFNRVLTEQEVEQLYLMTGEILELPE